MKKQQIIVVEGKSDTNRLKQIDPNIITFQTLGLGLDDDKLNELIKLSKDYELIVLTDPDGPGERIRTKINQAIPDVKNAFLRCQYAKDDQKHKVGLEHASDEEIKHALSHLYQASDNVANYMISDLVNWGIYNSKAKRKSFCDLLNISFGNNQKVVKQLNAFNISMDKINSVLEQIN